MGAAKIATRGSGRSMAIVTGLSIAKQNHPGLRASPRFWIAKRFARSWLVMAPPTRGRVVAFILRQPGLRASPRF
jgi:hypothetical protein